MGKKTDDYKQNSMEKVMSSYFDKYAELIKANEGTKGKYTESHHVYPKAFEANIFDEYRVSLSYADHVRAHYYLFKMFEHDVAAAKALCFMLQTRDISSLSEEELEGIIPAYIKARQIANEAQKESQAGNGNFNAKYKLRVRWYHAETNTVEYGTPAEMSAKYEHTKKIERSDRPGQYKKNYLSHFADVLKGTSISVKGWVLDETGV